MEYTPGKWYQLRDRENRHHVMSKGKTGDMEQNVAIMSVRPEAKANAQLIASAPELYGACKAGYEFIRHLRALEPESDIEEFMDKALAKAEGN